MALTVDFYRRSDTLEIARDLIGCTLMSDFGNVTGGIITEVEAYCGKEDRACHAYNGRRTKRTEVMYAPGGVAYVYLCYGMHHLFNIVTHSEDIPHAILIRALEPTLGIDVMRKRRGGKRNVAGGPGMVCQAMGILTEHTGESLIDGRIWVEKRKNPARIKSSKRIGIDYAGPDRDLPYRFNLA